MGLQPNFKTTVYAFCGTPGAKRKGANDGAKSVEVNAVMVSQPSDVVSRGVKGP